MKHPHLRTTKVNVFTTILICAVILVLTLACGTLATMPLQATQTAPVPIVTNTEAIRHVPEMLTVLGDELVTWNVRPEPSLNSEPNGIAYGGDVFEKLSTDGGWVLTEAGWICGQAFGLSNQCK